MVHPEQTNLHGICREPLADGTFIPDLPILGVYGSSTGVPFGKHTKNRWENHHAIFMGKSPISFDWAMASSSQSVT